MPCKKQVSIPVPLPMAQAATGVGVRGSPREGDGFTFEHLAAREELWLDFCADTGDGGCAAPLAHACPV